MLKSAKLSLGRLHKRVLDKHKIYMLFSENKSKQYNGPLFSPLQMQNVKLVPLAHQEIGKVSNAVSSLHTKNHFKGLHHQP